MTDQTTARGPIVSLSSPWHSIPPSQSQPSRPQRRAHARTTRRVRLPLHSLVFWLMVLNLCAWVLFLANGSDLVIGTLSAPLHIYIAVRLLVVTNH